MAATEARLCPKAMCLNQGFPSVVTVTVVRDLDPHGGGWLIQKYGMSLANDSHVIDVVMLHPHSRR